MIRDILNLSQLSKPQEIFKPVDLNECLRSVLVDLEMTIEEKRAKITFGQLPVINAIAPQMSQLFFNLLSNSLKFVRKDQDPQIVISTDILNSEKPVTHSSLDPTQPYCLIRIQDNGIGFDEKYAEQIFTIFQRLNSRQQYSGTGIGLALCKKIVTNHKGLISAKSREGEGATFEVVLPLTLNK